MRLGLLAIGLILSSTLSFAELSKEAIQDEVKRGLVSALTKDYPYVSASDVQSRFINLKSIFIEETVSEFDYDLSHIRHVLGRSAIPIQFYDHNGTLVSETQLTVKVDATAPFLKTRKKLSRGTVFSVEDIEVVHDSLYGKSPYALHDLSQLKDKESRLTLSKGVVLTSQMLKPQSAVRLGDIVTVLYELDNLKLRVRGEAKEDGAVGDMIKIKVNLGKGKILKGEVIDSSTVLVKAQY